MDNEKIIISPVFWNTVAKQWVQKAEYQIQEAPTIVPMENESKEVDFDPFNLDDI